MSNTNSDIRDKNYESSELNLAQHPKTIPNPEISKVLKEFSGRKTKNKIQSDKISKCLSNKSLIDTIFSMMQEGS